MARGNITPRKCNRDKQVTGEEGEIKVLVAVVVDPQISSRGIAQGNGMSQASVLCILHRPSSICITSHSIKYLMAMM